MDKGGVTFSAGLIGPAPYPLGPLRDADSSHLAVEDESNLSTGKCHDHHCNGIRWYLVDSFNYLLNNLKI